MNRKSNAWKRILSLVLTMMLVAAPLTVSTVAEETAGEGTQTAATEAEQQTPPQETPAVILPSVEVQTLPDTPKIVSSRKGSVGGGMSDKIYADIPFDWDSGRDLTPVDGGGSTRSGDYSPNASINPGSPTTTLHIAYSDTQYQVNVPFTKVYESSHAIVYTESSLLTATGITANSESAKKVADEFERIYAMFSQAGSTYMGVPHPVSAQSDKIKIALSDIMKGEDSSLGYTGGYFDPNDFFDDGRAGANNDNLLYIDIGTNSGEGFDSFRYDFTGFMGTVAHEYQHMIHFSSVFKHRNNNTAVDYPGDPDTSNNAAINHSIWLNEGLSGLAEIFYTGQINEGHLASFLSNGFYSSYVPSTPDWYTSYDVLPNYGAAAMLMSEFHQYKPNNITKLIDDPQMRWIGSLYNVGKNFNDSASYDTTLADFNKYFRAAMLDIAVDTPDGTEAAVSAVTGGVYHQNRQVPNVWQARNKTYPSHWGFGSYEFLGVKENIQAGQTYNTDAHQFAYFSELYMAESVGPNNGRATIDVPADGAEYYAIYPVGATGVNDAAKWVSAAKTAVLLDSSTPKTVTVGTDNRFAILRVNYQDDPGSGPLSYTTAPIKGVSAVEVTPSVQGGLVAGDSGQSIAVKAKTNQLTTADQVKAVVVDANDAAVAGFGAEQTQNVDSAGEVNFTFNVADTTPSGIYRVKTTYVDGSEAYFVYSEPFALSVRASLQSPTDGATGVSADLDKITIDFDATVNGTGVGQVMINISGGGTYYAPLTGSGTSLTINTADFKNNGKNAIFAYGSSVTVNIEANAVVSGDSVPNAARFLGSFDIEGEPSTPTAIPSTINLVRGDTGHFAAYFGTSGSYTQASITANSDPDAVTVPDTAITTSGDTFDVQAVKAGTAILTIGYSGPNNATDSKSVTVNVTDTRSEYYIVATAGVGGSISPSDTVTVPVGGNQTFTINPMSNYGIIDVKVNGASMGPINRYTFEDVQSDQTISAEFIRVSGGYNPGGGSTGGGGGGGNSGNVYRGADGDRATTSTPSNAPVDVTTSAAESAAAKAAEAAKAAGSSTATATLKNPGNITKAALDAMVKKAGMPLKVKANSMSTDGKFVEVQLSFDPAKATKDVNLSGSLTNARAKSVMAYFQKWYSNKLAVVSLGQQGDFGMPVEVAAKVDLSGMDTTKLVFYSYNRTTGEYTRIAAPAYWIDKNGYVHFTTTLAGDIVISEGILAKK